MSPERAAIAVTGLGAVSALGPDLASLLHGLRTGRSGLAPPTRLDLGDLPARPVGEVGSLPGDPGEGGATHRLALAAAREAWRDAAATGDPARIAVVMGTTTGGIGESERWYLATRAGVAADPSALRHHAVCTVTAAVARAVGATGPTMTLSTACSSGANALTVAADLLRSGAVDRVVAGGADALCLTTYAGFSSLRLMSEHPCRPFDRDRDGLSLGEGAACLVLEREPDARARGARIHALLLGSAVSCDAHHMTAPAPDGHAVHAALIGALAEAGVAPSEVGYVNAHGTATPANDEAEARALERVFGASGPPVSASKSFLGHTLGAAGALEAVITVLALREGLLPATLGTEHPGPDAPRDLVLGAPREAAIRVALSTSFAFGGNNAVLVFGRSEA
ncbi:MAG: beta-ketoacyl-[acyl-carrier-protein] synthase family protein [Deltaproteobacteria bacterium]|nr:beta-ketoacyl-[acyl-carrier-protein] synthase family protein [Deltaproteobacteria bacterium]MCB9787217.1 beta-ketoacyl-[acyl-carrier-protein] synthase family protein [Deltaproteobacteria bacterium]